MGAVLHAAVRLHHLVGAVLHTAVRLHHLVGAIRINADTSGGIVGSVVTSQGGAAHPCESKFREFLRVCIALNINYLFSPKGLSVQCLFIWEMVIVLKVKSITI